MKTLASFSLGLVALTLSGLAHAAGDGAFEQVERGRYLATVGDCAACHTASTPNAKPFAGGVPIETPFGRLVGANITPDPETGRVNSCLKNSTDTAKVPLGLLAVLVTNKLTRRRF